jgi:outer membrane lipoprotein-sorting protein
MRTIRVAALFCLPLLSFAVTTDEVLARMDSGSSKFAGMSANLNKLTYTKVIDDKSEESGAILLKKVGPKQLQVKIDFTKPDVRTVAFKGRKAEIYYPKLKTVQEIDLGKHTDLLDQFLLLGFGTSGKELQSNYAVKIVGEETVGGEKTYKLELLPKSANMKEKVERLELWISGDGVYPVRQRFIEPSGNYTVFTYSDVKLNPPLTDEILNLNLPKGVKREYPQK